MIPPYGETDNDWLGLEIRKGQGHSRFISTRELRFAFCESLRASNFYRTQSRSRDIQGPEI